MTDKKAQECGFCLISVEAHLFEPGNVAHPKFLKTHFGWWGRNRDTSWLGHSFQRQGGQQEFVHHLTGFHLELIPFFKTPRIIEKTDLGMIDRSPQSWHMFIDRMGWGNRLYETVEAKKNEAEAETAESVKTVNFCWLVEVNSSKVPVIKIVREIKWDELSSLAGKIV